MKNKKILINKKGEISITMLIFIVLGVVVLVVSIYLIYKGGKSAGAAGDCSGECKAAGESCPSGYYKTLTSCKTSGDKKGKCCAEELG